jgi:acyl-CoA thioesterase I
MRGVFESFFAGIILPWLIMGMPALARADSPPIRIVVYGDSLTSGYQLPVEDGFPVKLDRKLREAGFDNIEVTNMSVANETTAGGVERLPGLLGKQPDIAVVELGSNDAQRGISTNLIYQNLVTILGRLRERNVYTVLVGIKAPPSMGYNYSAQLDAVYAGVAGFYKAALYPSALEGVLGNPKLTLADGYHPNAKGTDVMVDGIYHLVDAGMRWKIDTLRYEKEYQQWQDSNQPTGQTGVQPNSSVPSLVGPSGLPPDPVKE